MIRSLLMISVFSYVFQVCVSGYSEEQEKNPVFQVIQKNLKAAEQEDLDAMMATIHPQNPGFEQTRKAALNLFERVDLKYTVKDLKVLSTSESEIKVAFKQTMRKIRGGVFSNNTITGVHVLRKHESKWKFFGTEIQKIEFPD